MYHEKCKILLLIVVFVLRIAVFLPFSKMFDYTFEGDAGAGDVVLVKFGKFEVYGVVCEVIPLEEYAPSGKFELKPAKMVVASGLISPVLMDFVRRAAAYNIGLVGMFFKLVFPFTKYVPAALRKAGKRDFQVRLGEGAAENSLRGKYWKETWAVLVRGSARLSELGLLKVQVELLREKGLILLEELGESAPVAIRSLPELSAEQTEVLRYILPHIYRGFNVFLVDGETGSGKTEVYFHLIAEILESSAGQVLLMLPEIALSSVILGRFEERFGFEPILWHSNVTEGKRQRNYEEISRGEARVVIGTRSSLFLPYKNLRLVIVDEEHDGSYKQDEMTCYHGRDMAVLRAKMEGIPVVLGSATPSVESYNNASIGKYIRLVLKSRFFGFKMPVMQVVDMRKEGGRRKNQFISDSVRVKMLEVLSAGGQAMLFLNRRGYAPIAVCTACGFKVKCKNCDVFMTEHRSCAQLKCHHCGYVREVPEHCLECGASGCFSVIGVGVERIMEEVQSIAAEYKAELLTSDTLASPVKTALVLERIQRGEVRIIVGTQVVSKGYHFANLRFVGILDADFGLNMEDFRAFEKTFQLLYQVAGRSGRESAESSVYIQTYEPQNQVLASIASYDKEKFYELEVETRRKFGLPPFSKQVGFVVSGEDREATLAFARTFGIALGAEFGGIHGVSIFGPTPAILSFLRQRYRFRLLLLSAKMPRVEEKIAKTAAKVVELEKISNKIMLKVDVDPVNFY